MGFAMELILRPRSSKLLETGKITRAKELIDARCTSLIHTGSPAGRLQHGPAAPTVETGTMVVRPADNWPHGATPRYALAEQFQYAGNSAAPWLEPVQQAVTQNSMARAGAACPG